MFKKAVKDYLKLYRNIKKKKSREEHKKKNNFPDLSVTTAFPATCEAKYKFSVVTAVYQVEKYLDDFFSSLVQQTVGFESAIEVILVDDGSHDKSPELCKKWASKFPENIKVITKENGGAASARNLGIQHASGDWLTFIDSDDVVCSNYFELVLDELIRAESGGGKVSLISCNVLFYDERNSSIKNRHPLKYKYGRGVRIVNFNKKSCKDVQLFSNSAFFKKNVVNESCIEFPDLKPGFEDCYFVAEYLLREGSKNVIFLPNAKYFYRKRADASSLIDNSWAKKEKFGEQIRDGNIRLLRNASTLEGHVGDWLQRTVLYDLTWHFKKFVNNNKNASLIPVEYRDEYLELLNNAFKLIDVNTIENFELAGIQEYHRLGMLSRFKGLHVASRWVRVLSYDHHKKAVLLGYYSSQKETNWSIYSSRGKLQPVAETSRRHHFLGDDFIWEWLGWFQWPGIDEIETEIDTKHVPLKLGRRLIDSISRSEVEKHFTPTGPNFKKLPLEKKAYRLLSKVSYYENRFKNAWIFIDRDTQADDNAEHLYRYVKKSQYSRNIWFVLRKKSHDWERLSREGFRLIEFGSYEHKIALLHASFIISSHANDYIFSLMPWNFYRDRINYKFIFLQHGVTKDNLSQWLNLKNIGMLVCSSRKEYDAFVQDGDYKFTTKEVALTGMPRHDKLLRKAKEDNKENADKNSIRVTFMPTWRQSLVGNIVGKGDERAVSPDFADSEFFQRWVELLANERLHDLSKKHNITLITFPHANLTPYVSLFREHGVQVVTHGEVESIQEEFIKTDLLVTDYSSVAFEMALLNKPVIYYQFDKDTVFSGGHTTEKGYFDYCSNGFGPVKFEASEVVFEIEQYINGGGPSSSEYQQRRDEFFEYRDGNNCRRVLQHIIDMEEPFNANSK